MNSLQLLKLGGSLITEKSRPHTARLDVIGRLANEIKRAREKNPEVEFVLGHGSGSFGHVPAHRYGTREGVHTPNDWLGFVEVWREAAALNRLVVEIFSAEHLPVVVFSPLSSVTAADGRVLNWDLYPIRAALGVGLIPVIHGDVIFDKERGGTILSTEDLFDHLVYQLEPKRVLLVGLEPGVWGDFPHCTHLLDEINPLEMQKSSIGIGGSTATDVTGGMINKVQQSLQWVQDIQGLEVLIFSGENPGTLETVLAGGKAGTRIFI